MYMSSIQNCEITCEKGQVKTLLLTKSSVAATPWQTTTDNESWECTSRRLIELELPQHQRTHLPPKARRRVNAATKKQLRRGTSGAQKLTQNRNASQLKFRRYCTGPRKTPELHCKICEKPDSSSRSFFQILHRQSEVFRKNQPTWEIN